MKENRSRRNRNGQQFIECYYHYKLNKIQFVTMRYNNFIYIWTHNCYDVGTISACTVINEMEKKNCRKFKVYCATDTFLT